MIFGLALALGASMGVPAAHTSVGVPAPLSASVASGGSWCAAPGVIEVWQQPWGTVETCIAPPVTGVREDTPPPVATIGYWDTPTSSYIVVTVAECATLPYCSGKGLG